jgi:hypothetical protein
MNTHDGTHSLGGCIEQWVLQKRMDKPCGITVEYI